MYQFLSTLLRHITVTLSFITNFDNKMVENNIRSIRKFKDKIAMLKNKQEYTNAQFDEAIRQVSEVKNIHIKQEYPHKMTRHRNHYR